MKTSRIEIGFFIFFLLFVVTMCIMIVFIGKYHECNKETHERTVVEVVKECRKP